MKKVSIIIPVYNVEHYIEESLRSALCQTYAEIEYIIVDDCGTDHSIEIARYLCDSVEYRYRQVKFVQHEYNRGVSAAVIQDYCMLRVNIFSLWIQTI